MHGTSRPPQPASFPPHFVMKCVTGIPLLLLISTLRDTSCQLEGIADLVQDNLSTDPDKNRGIQEFINSRGFDYQLYTVQTADGYDIDVHRIIHPYKKVTKQPVLFASVLAGAGVEWLRNSPGGNVNESTQVVGPNIGFEVAKRGYDVWIMDFRGKGSPDERYNRNLDLQYYDYSMDEYALFDLPVAIDLVMRVTKASKIAYVSLIDSTTVYFMLASMVRRFNHLMQPVIALSPTWTQYNSTHPSEKDIRQTRRKIRQKVDMRGPEGVGGVPLPPPVIEAASRLLCNLKITQRFLCNPFFYLGLRFTFTKGKVGSVNYDRLSVYASTATRTTRGSEWQSAQLESFTISKRVKMLDVNPQSNMERYCGSPREYMPERITNPEIHFMNAESSQSYTIADMDPFKKRLGTKVRSEINVPKSVDWSPMSFQDGRPDDVSQYVNAPILKILKSYN